MLCTQRDLSVSYMMAQKAFHKSQKATTDITFTDDVGGLTMDNVKTGRSSCIPPCARNAILK